MSFTTRLRLLFLILPMIILGLLATAFILLATWQRDTVRDSFAAELLEEGGVPVEALALEFFTHLGHHVDETMSRQEYLDALSELDGEARSIVAMDYEGNDLLAPRSDPHLLQLLDAETRVGLVAQARRDGVDYRLIDNYDAFLRGTTAYPIRAYFKVVPEHEILVGHGRVQSSGKIRLETAYRQAWWHWLQLLIVAGSLLLIALVVLIALSQMLVRRWVSVPVAAFRGEVEALGAAAPTGADLSAGADIDEVALALRRLSKEQHTIRTELAEERAARYRAEEERDRLQTEIRRAIAEETTQLSEKFEQRQQDDRHALHTRVVKALGVDTAGTLGLAADPDAPRGEPVNIDTLLGEIAEESGISPEARLTSESTIAVDREQLKRAILGLLKNASDAIDGRANGRVALESMQVDGACEIRVVDNGCGIPENLRPLVMLPLFTTRDDHLGAGLGYARDVAQAHGGELVIQSETEKGTVVILRLPMEKTN